MTDQLKNYRFIDQGFDYTFRFYPNGTVTIINNDSNTTIRPRDLSGPPLEFYARKNIQHIKHKLREVNRNAAG